MGWVYIIKYILTCWINKLVLVYDEKHHQKSSQTLMLFALPYSPMCKLGLHDTAANCLIICGPAHPLPHPWVVGFSILAATFFATFFRTMALKLCNYNFCETVLDLMCLSKFWCKFYKQRWFEFSFQAEFQRECL